MVNIYLCKCLNRIALVKSTCTHDVAILYVFLVPWTRTVTIRIGLYLHAWKTWHWCIVICTRNRTIWRLFIFACKRNWKTWHWCIIICTRYGTIWRLFIFACERNWKTRHRIYLFARVMWQYGVCLYLHANVIGKHDIGV